jgi:chromosome segregation ATPase
MGNRSVTRLTGNNQSHSEQQLDYGTILYPVPESVENYVSHPTPATVGEKDASRPNSHQPASRKDTFHRATMKADLMCKQDTQLVSALVTKMRKRSINAKLQDFRKVMNQVKDLDGLQAWFLREKTQLKAKSEELTRQLARQHKLRAQLQKDKARLSADREAVTLWMRGIRQHFQEGSQRLVSERMELQGHSEALSRDHSHLRAEHNAERNELSRQRDEFKIADRELTREIAKFRAECDATRKELARERSQLQTMADKVARASRLLKLRT